MDEKTGLLGVLSMIGTYIVLVLVAVKLGGVGIILDEMGILLTGGVQQLTQEHATFLMMIPAIVAVVVLELPCTIGMAIAQDALADQEGEHGVSELLRNMTEGNHFFMFFVVVLVEELFARWLFLGLLPQISFLSGPLAFYALFLLGNGIWALAHLWNFRDPQDRHWLRVLPQFVGGIFYTYIFVKHGFLAAVLAHFASNAVLFAIHKIRHVTETEVLIVLYMGVCASVSYILMDKPLSDALVWLASEPEFELPGWSFWDYVKLSVFIPSIFGLLFGILLYDRGAIRKETEHPSFGEYVLLIPLTIALMYGLYALLGLVISDVPYRILILAILLACVHRGASGSSVARTFWTGLPTIYVSICILQALGWWASIAWLTIQTIIGAPKEILERREV